MISCTEAVRQLWEYLDDTVAETDRAQIEEHLQRCRRCCGELEFAHELRGLLVDATHEDLPEDVLQRLTQQVEELDP